MSNGNGNGSRRFAGTATLLRPDQSETDAGRRREWTGEPSSYYGVPLIKKAHWSWQIYLYFFLGGIAGGSYLVSTLAHFLGIDSKLVRSGRYLSFACLLASPILLIMDLGRPARFHHMLRILKFRSPMSLGTWALSAFGMFCGLTTAHQVAEDGLLNWFPLAGRLFRSLPIKVIDAFGSFFGLFVASYTGVLLSSTAVPIWARAKHILGPLFLTSGVSTGLSALSLILSLGRSNHDTLKRLDRAEMIAMTTELGLIGSLVPTLGPLGKPLFRGQLGLLFNAGTIGGGLLMPLLLKLGFIVSGRRPSRGINIAASLLALTGGFILRYAWVKAGRTSADDPLAVHYYNKL
jgi:formate-dependent nitrite reductase membrane component NrfD